MPSPGALPFLPAKWVSELSQPPRVRASTNGSSPGLRVPLDLGKILVTGLSIGERDNGFTQYAGRCRGEGFAVQEALALTEYVWERAEQSVKDHYPLARALEKVHRGYRLWQPNNAKTDDAANQHGWEPADLQAILDGNAQIPAPTLLRRSDGICLLYPGKLHTFHGEAESGKSWAALLAVKQEIETGHCAVYVDFEDCAQTLLTRLGHLGLDPALTVEYLTYITPTDPLGDRASTWLHAFLTERQPALVVLDGVTEAMHLHGLDPLANVDFAEFRRVLLRPLLRAGAAVVQIDHVTKDANTRGRYAIGSQHKLAAIDGAAFSFSIAKPFAPDADGLITLKVAKDRHGEVCRHAPGGSDIAKLRMSADGRLTLEPPSDNGGKQVPPNLVHGAGIEGP
jgi:hypothetical protein